MKLGGKPGLRGSGGEPMGRGVERERENSNDRGSR